MLKFIKTIKGNISPKSIVSSNNGLISAHNMMYKHTITIYDANKMILLKTISDKIDSIQGAPVEGVFSPDKKYLYVTNYSMYGKGFKKPGKDIGCPKNNFDNSYLYRINLSNFRIDAKYLVGSVPKVVTVTPDNKYIIVSNWCSFNISIISIEKQKVIKTIYIGKYPRGLTVSDDSKYVYVAEMGGAHVHVINLHNNFTKKKFFVGNNPRTIIYKNNILFITLNNPGKVVIYDIALKTIIATIKTGAGSRSMDISSDGLFLYIVNYGSNTIVVVSILTFKIIQTIKCNKPIGITYDSLNNRVWVASYNGFINIYKIVK
jgi:YVTN family beta-propeller protein